MARRDPVVETLLHTLLAGFVLLHSTTTILQDWRKSRHSEVDDINGHVIRTLERLGRSAPVNAAVAELAYAIERGELHPDPANLELLAARVRDRRTTEASSLHDPGSSGCTHALSARRGTIRG